VKQYLARLLVGPALMASACGIGMFSGYVLGFVAACVIVPAIILVVGVVAARWVGGTIAMLGIVLALIPGLVAAHDYRNLRWLETGEFVRGVALADLPRLHAARLTLADGEARGDLGKIVSHTSTWGGPSDRVHQTSRCEAFPIVDERWSNTDPVRVWRFGDPEPSTTYSLRKRVFELAQPNELCREAIDRASTRSHLTTAPDAVYLEAKVVESSDEHENRWGGLAGVVGLGGLWLVVVFVQILRRRN
jgi:hypothetical protein